MAAFPEVIITNNIDADFLDEEKDVKNKNLQVDLSSITDDSSNEDISKIHVSSTNQRVISSDKGEKVIEINVTHIRSPSEETEKWKPNIYKDKILKYTRRNSVDIDKNSTYLHMKNLSALRDYSTSKKETRLIIPPDIYGGNFALDRNKLAISSAQNKNDVTSNTTELPSPFSLDRQKNATKILMEDDSSLCLFPFNKDEGVKDNLSIISTESTATMSTLKDFFQISSVKDRPSEPIVQPEATRTHSRITGFYRNCSQTFITKHARLKRRDWTNTGFVITGLYVFGFLCLGYTVFNTVSINPIIIFLGVFSREFSIIYFIFDLCNRKKPVVIYFIFWGTPKGNIQ